MKPEIREHFKKPNFLLRSIVIGFIVLIVFGFLIDMFSGFYILRHSTSLYAGLTGLLILTIFNLIGEAGSVWIGGKDDVADPLYKRAFRLLALLSFAAFILAALWSGLKYLGLIRI